MVVFLLATVTLSAGSLSLTAYLNISQSALADNFLWLVAFCCFVLAAYSCVVTFSLFSALICPPLEETR